MLKHWDTHAEYQHFISEALTLLNPSQLKLVLMLDHKFTGVTNWAAELQSGDLLAMLIGYSPLLPLSLR